MCDRVASNICEIRQIARAEPFYNGRQSPRTASSKYPICYETINFVAGRLPARSCSPFVQGNCVPSCGASVTLANRKYNIIEVSIASLFLSLSVSVPLSPSLLGWALEGQWARRGKKRARGSREGKKAGRRVIGKEGGEGRTMRVSLNICPEVRRRLPFSFSFAYGVHCECAPRGTMQSRRVPCKRDRVGNAS